MTKTQDGFLIADEDLRLRGPGDFWGTRQSGEPLFQIANPIEDQEILIEAREVAVDWVKSGKYETTGEWSGIKNFLEQNPLRY